MTYEEIAAKYGATEVRPPDDLGPPDEQSAKTYIGETISNIPSSAYRMGEGIVTALANPIDTASTVIDLGAGVLQNILPESAVQFIGEDKRSRELANKVGQMLVDRYGSIDDAKKTIKTDPVGVMGDIATVLGLGAVTAPAKLAGPLRKATEVVDPVSLAAKTTGGVIKGAKEGIKAYSGVTTGVGRRPLEEAFAAGAEGGSRQQTFRENISGVANQTAVLDMAKNALGNLRDQRSRDYLSGMDEVGKDIEAINMQPILEVVKEAQKRGRFGEQVIDANAEAAVRAASSKIRQWVELDPAQYHTALGVDALKRSIGAQLDGLKNQPNAYGAVKEIYDSIGSEIRSQAPQYDSVMKEYSEMTNLIQEMERTLSLNPQASIDTSMRKLQSLMRDNVQTNYGQRVKLGEQLADAGAQDMMAGLAGQTLSEMAPRGIARAPAGGVPAAFLYSGNIPAAAASAVAASPRVAGEISNIAGQLAGGARRATQSASDAVPTTIPETRYTPSVGIGRDAELSLLNAITDPVFRNIILNQMGRAQGL